MAQSGLEHFIFNLTERFKNAIINTCTEEIEQAKQIEEDQLFEFWKGGIDSTEEDGKSFDQFYETYNK